jgi:hypothetical protein
VYELILAFHGLVSPLAGPEDIVNVQWPGSAEDDGEEGGQGQGGGALVPQLQLHKGAVASVDVQADTKVRRSRGRLNPAGTKQMMGKTCQPTCKQWNEQTASPVVNEQLAVPEVVSFVVCGLGLVPGIHYNTQKCMWGPR